MTWVTLATMVVTLLAAVFTGNGDVSDEQAAALNLISPGLGSAFQTAVGAANGLAPTYTEWAADTTLLKSVGLMSPFGSVGGVLGNITGFLANVNPIILIGGGFLAWKLLFSNGGGGDPRFWKSSRNDEQDYLV